MPDLRGLLADPQFNALPLERRQAILERVNPDLAREYVTRQSKGIAPTKAFDETPAQPGVSVGQMFTNAGQSILGAGKQLANQAVSLAGKTPSGLIAQHMGPPGSDVMFQPYFTLDNEAQRAGAQGLNFLEFLTPGGATKGAVGAAAQAAKSGATAAFQGAGAKDIATSAAIGAAGPIAAKVAGVAAPLLRKAAETQYGRALNATTKYLKQESRRIVPQLLDRRISGSLESLAKRGAEESGAVGRKLADEYADATASGQLVDTAPILRSLDAMKKRFFVTGVGGQSVNTNPAAVEKVKAIQTVIKKFGGAVEPDQLWKMRKNFDDIIKAGGGFGPDLVPATTKALQREARLAIQKELTKVSPNIEKLNSEFSLWKGLESVAKGTIERRTGQLGIVETGLRTGVGASVGLLLGGGDSEWGTVGALLGAVTKHPLYRTVSAVEKARLAHTMAHGQAPTVAAILSRSLAGFAARDGGGTSDQRSGPSAQSKP